RGAGRQPRIPRGRRHRGGGNGRQDLTVARTISAPSAVAAEKGAAAAAPSAMLSTGGGVDISARNEPRLRMRSGLAISVIVHATILTLGLFFAGVSPFDS